MRYDVVSHVELPFPFVYFGRTVTALGISPNGFVRLCAPRLPPRGLLTPTAGARGAAAAGGRVGLEYNFRYGGAQTTHEIVQRTQNRMSG